MYTILASARTFSRIVRAKVLIVVQHPVVGSGLETLLRLEDRYETRRVGRISDTESIVASWRPDLALVDGVLLRDGEHASLGIPSLVLSGSAAAGDGLRRKLDDARGWLRKDPTPDELFAAIDRVCGTSDPGMHVGRATLIAALAATGVMLFLAWGFLALRSAG